MEIHDVGPKRFLAIKPDAKLVPPQMKPEPLFRVGQTPTQLASEILVALNIGQHVGESLESLRRP
jgi:hypothetical protein